MQFLKLCDMRLRHVWVEMQMIDLCPAFIARLIVVENVPYSCPTKISGSTTPWTEQHTTEHIYQAPHPPLHNIIHSRTMRFQRQRHLTILPSTIPQNLNHLFPLTLLQNPLNLILIIPVQSQPINPQIILRIITNSQPRTNNLRSNNLEI